MQVAWLGRRSDGLRINSFAVKVWACSCLALAASAGAVRPVESESSSDVLALKAKSIGTHLADSTSIVSYTPSVHSHAVEQAWLTLLMDNSSNGDSLKNILDRYERLGLYKVLDQSCGHFWSSACGDNAECLHGKCHCEGGFGASSPNGQCKAETLPLSLYPVQTEQPCEESDQCASLHTFASCSARRCTCQQGFARGQGGRECIPWADYEPKEAEEQILQMMKYGAREPDDKPCKDDVYEQGTMYSAVAGMLIGQTVFNMSVCRIAAQVYHASPLPLVAKEELDDPPLTLLSTPATEVPDYVAIMSQGQFRGQFIKALAAQFAYAIALPNAAEGARRLGNLFHSFSDSFSASHIERASSDHGFAPTFATCKKMAMNMAYSMDTMNFMVHVFADFSDDDIFYQCAVFFMVRLLQLWAGARESFSGLQHHERPDLSSINGWLDKLVEEVLCPALELDPAAEGAPAGGSSWHYSAMFASKASLPAGLASEKDSERILLQWQAKVAAGREHDKTFPRRIEQVPPRSLDVCTNRSFAYVDASFLDKVHQAKLSAFYALP